MSVQVFSEAVKAKGRRYVAQGAVSVDPQDPTVLRVQGTAPAPYVVRLLYSEPGRLAGASCSCRFGGASGALRVTACSHVAAALAVVRG